MPASIIVYGPGNAVRHKVDHLCDRLGLDDVIVVPTGDYGPAMLPRDGTLVITDTERRADRLARRAKHSEAPLRVLTLDEALDEANAQCVVDPAQMDAFPATTEHTTAEPAPVTADSILTAAAQHMRDRAALRDQPQGERSMARTVAAFNALTGHALSERDGWLFMVVLKAARAVITPPGNVDDYQDGAAYFGLAGEAAARA